MEPRYKFCDIHDTAYEEELGCELCLSEQEDFLYGCSNDDDVF